jgi:putative ABC transport system substrate-binding protein
MGKKTVVVLLVGLTLAAVHSADAQQPKKVARIGFLGSNVAAYRIDALKQGLRDLGWVEDQNITIEYWPSQRDQLSEFAAKLVSLKVDLIVASSTDSALAAKQATTTIPIVVASTADPVGSGLVASLARPGGNVTGVANLETEIGGKRVELLKEVVATVSRLAALWIPTSVGSQAQMKEIEVVSRSLHVRLQPVGVEGRSDFDNAFSAITRERPNGLITLSAPLFDEQRTRIINFAVKNRLPAIYPRREFAEADGLMAYGPSIIDQYRRVATYVDKILKGAKTRRLAGRAANEVRVHHQSESCETDRSDDSAERAGESG